MVVQLLKIVGSLLVASSTLFSPQILRATLEATGGLGVQFCTVRSYSSFRSFLFAGVRCSI
jgi:hypothetical protein